MEVGDINRVFFEQICFLVEMAPFLSIQASDMYSSQESKASQPPQTGKRRRQQIGRVLRDEAHNHDVPRLPQQIRHAVEAVRSQLLALLLCTGIQGGRWFE